MASLFRRTYYTTNANGKRIKKKTAKWYGKYRDENGDTQRPPLSTNKTVARQLLDKLLEKVERKKAGRYTPADEHAGRPLSEHLADYQAALEAKGRSPEDVRQTLTRIKAIVQGCGFAFAAQIEVTAVRDFLARLQRVGDVPELPAGQEWFAPKELAALLGIWRQSMTALLRRHGLHTTGQGKARSRKFPRSTALHLLELSSRGLGSQTASHYWSEFKAFCRWLASPKQQRLDVNPLEDEEGPSPRAEPRHDRRPLPPDDLRRLLDVTRASRRTWRGLTGLDRWHVYLTACVTGYRRKELASLTPRSFDLDGEPAVVSLPGGAPRTRSPPSSPFPPTWRRPCAATSRTARPTCPSGRVRPCSRSSLPCATTSKKRGSPTLSRVWKGRSTSTCTPCGTATFRWSRSRERPTRRPCSWPGTAPLN
jgi:integrase/recombinase XerC